MAQWHAVDGQGVPRASIAEGELSDGELAANRIGYAGYVFDAEHELYRVRYRSYLPIDGRWAQRDPMGYGDGVNVFSYALASPLVHADPSGLKIGIDPNLKNPGRQNFIDEIRDAIQSMCPGADVGPNGEIEVAAMDENKECEEPCNGSPPGCDILGDLVDSGNIIFLTPTKKRSQIAYGVNGNPTWIGLNDPGRPKRDRDGNIRPGHEEVWHEIIHAYRHDKGWVPNPHAIKPGSYDFSVEEFETILQNNELRKWYQECGDGGGGDPGLLDPSSHPSIRPIDKNRLRKRDRMPDHLIKFN